jgi:hypothetical protein
VMGRPSLVDGSLVPHRQLRLAGGESLPASLEALSGPRAAIVSPQARK